MTTQPRLSIVMPVLNEAPQIAARLAALQTLRAKGVELVVADGGSVDATVAVIGTLADRIIVAPRGRASQMNAGAAASRGRVLLFLHADTRLPDSALADILATIDGGSDWGRFDVRIDGRPALLRVVAFMMNWRSRLTGIATGDQAMFVTRAAFEQAGRFPQQPLMEDIELSARLRRVGRPACLAARATTSGRRWERDGAWRTILLMWRLRFAYWRGAPPAELHRRYYGPPR